MQQRLAGGRPAAGGGAQSGGLNGDEHPAWPPEPVAHLFDVPGVRVQESAYVLGLFDESRQTAQGALLRALYVGAAGEGAARLQRRLQSHAARLQGLTVPRLSDEVLGHVGQPPSSSELEGLAAGLGISEPRWRLVTHWASVPSGWEDLVAGALRRAAEATNERH